MINISDLINPPREISIKDLYVNRHELFDILEFQREKRDWKHNPSAPHPKSLETLKYAKNNIECFEIILSNFGLFDEVKGIRISELSRVKYKNVVNYNSWYQWLLETYCLSESPQIIKPFIRAYNHIKYGVNINREEWDKLLLTLRPLAQSGPDKRSYNALYHILNGWADYRFAYPNPLYVAHIITNGKEDWSVIITKLYEYIINQTTQPVTSGLNNPPRYKMYGLVPYNISEIQAGIQFGHAVVEYGLKTNFNELYVNWAKHDKTFIILNGGTTNNDPNNLGTLNKHYQTLLNFGIEVGTFNEPDFGNQLTAVVFLVDTWMFPKPDEVVSNTFYEFLKQFKLR